MAIPTTKPGSTRRRKPERLYDPSTETDPLVQQYVTLPPPGGRNDARLRGLDGGLYPIWSVMLDYRAAQGDIGRLLAHYRSTLTPEHIAAAVRFTELYPEEVLPLVDEIERAG